MEFLLLAGILSIFHEIILELFALIIRIVLGPFGIKIYKTSDEAICKSAMRKSIFSSYSTDISDHSGIIISRRFIGFIKESKNYRGINEHLVILFCSKNTFESLSRVEIQQEGMVIREETRYINMIYHAHNVHGSLKRKKIFETRLVPSKQQNKIIDYISDDYGQSDTGSGVYLLYGDIGTGKSSVAYLLSKKIKGSLCTSFSPIKPGHSMNELYSVAGPTTGSPLVVLIDEIDVIIDQITSGEVVKTAHGAHTMCCDKLGWNSFLDAVGHGEFPNVLIIFTTNKKPEYFNDKDPSYIRNGRINKIFEVIR